MKYLLVVTFCSFMSGDCPIEFHDETIYKDWSSCMKSGIEKSKGIIEGLDNETINNLKVAPKFMCYETNIDEI